MKSCRIYLYGLLAALCLSSCDIVNHIAIKTYNRSTVNAPFDVVIVPGLPYDTVWVNPIFKARMHWAKELHEKGVTRNVIFSGNAVHSPYIEGAIMKMMADSMGIPTRHTFIEDKAEHSVENVDYGVELAQRMGFKKIAIATDPLQAMYLKKYTARHYPHVKMLPFSLKSIPAYYKSQVPKVNHANAYVENFQPLKEREQ